MVRAANAMEADDWREIAKAIVSNHERQRNCAEKSIHRIAAEKRIRILNSRIEDRLRRRASQAGLARPDH
jgi:hypothetical protein